MIRLFWICLAGAIGTAARYLLSGWTLRLLGPAFPFGTLAVNVLGSFLLGAVMFAGLHTNLMSPTLRQSIAIGGIGGFTTYSTFNYETLELFRERAWLLGALNLGATVIACLIAGMLGWVGARLVLTR